MRKKEYVHTHALLAEVTRHLIENEDMPVGALSDYDALDTRPSSLYKSKRDHHEAILVLGNAIEPWLERARDEGQARPVNGPR